MLRCRIEEQFCRSERILGLGSFQEIRDSSIVWFDFAVPLLDSGLLPGEVLVAMTFLAGVFDSHLLIKGRTWYRNAMVRPGISQPLANSMLLKIGHVARRAEIPG